ncbi:LamG domain-containing protein, partial [Oleiphilus sp. HI0123]
SYSGSASSRNFALQQTLYNYDFYNTTNDFNEALSTADADERLQASLQHVVATYSATQGRKLYVNGVYTEDEDSVAPGLLNGWNESFALVLGNETDGNELWEGTLRMLAIHSRALTQEQITQNYNSGVGEKFYMLFGV